MGGHGRCCCGECECLAVGDLPNISISGMTGGAWQQTECCWTKTFTFNTAQAVTTVCLPVHSKSDYTVTCEADIYAMRAPLPPLFLDACEDWPLPIEYCCTQDAPYLIGSREATCKGTWQQRMRVSYKAKDIVVKASRQNYSCDGVPACKLVLYATYNYEYNFLVMTEEDSDTSYSVVAAENQSCVQQGDPFPDCSEALTEPSVSFDCTTPLGTSQFGISFTRVKIYDAWPTGAVQFTNSDVLPEGCSTPICNDDDFATQACIQITGDQCKFACPVGTLTTSSITPPNICDDTFIQYAFTCLGPFSTVEACTETAGDDRECSSISRGVIAFPGGDYPDCENEHQCNGFGITWEDPYSYGFFNNNTTGGTIPAGFFAPLVLPCIEYVDPAPTECQWGDDPCGGNFARDSFPFFTNWFDDITSYSYSATCSNTTQSLCINAPSWTITFA